MTMTSQERRYSEIIQGACRQIRGRGPGSPRGNVIVQILLGEALRILECGVEAANSIEEGGSDSDDAREFSSNLRSLLSRGIANTEQTIEIMRELGEYVAEHYA